METQWTWRWHCFWKDVREVIQALRQQRMEVEDYGGTPVSLIEQKEQRLQKANEVIMTMRQEEAEWLSIASDPNATADALRRIVTSDVQVDNKIERIENSFGEFDYLSAANRYPWKGEFRRAIASHPNVPIDLFGSELPTNEDVLTGLLSNPAFPLILLECPDFLERLDQNNSYWDLPKLHQYRFARFILQKTVVPAYLLKTLETINDPWLTLEARTHISAEDPDVPTEPNLEWLEAQIVDLLQGEVLYHRCLIHELGCHGLLPRALEPTVPWHSLETSPEEDAVHHQMVAEYVHQINKTGRWKPAHRRYALDFWAKDVMERKEMGAKVRQWEEACFHPKMGRWVGEFIANGWSEKPDERNWAIWSFQRIMTLRQGKANEEVIRQHREQAIFDALCPIWPLGRPGIFYLLLRESPDLLLERRWEHIKEASFLVKLAALLHRNHSDPESENWYDLLRDDTNRYLRAAARRELVWPNRQ